MVTRRRPDETETEADAAIVARQSAARTRVHLLVRERGKTQVVDVEDGATLLIGRASEAAVVVEDTRASRMHARLRRRGEELVLEDLGSRNGTRVSGETVARTSRVIAGGALIEIGGCEIVVATSTVPAGVRAVEGPGAADPATSAIVVADASMAKVFTLARRVAAAPTTVLILGETGVGKDVLAQQIHEWSPRAGAPFVRVNCAALPDALLESELFGHERGAFTGAERRKEGYFDAAHGGTLLLDEIGELPLGVQAKLLHALENGAITRVGGTKEVAVDVRVLCATHRDLPAAVRKGKFREDLYYRISAFALKVPPLRERRSEVTLLAELFARRFAERQGMPTPSLAEEAREALREHGWPGNIRELRNALEHAVVLAEGGVIQLTHLPETIAGPSGAAPPSRAPEPAPSGGGMRDELAEIERARIRDALAAEGGNQTRAAQRLGISRRRTLVYKLSKYRIDR